MQTKLEKTVACKRAFLSFVYNIKLTSNFGPVWNKQRTNDEGSAGLVCYILCLLQQVQMLYISLLGSTLLWKYKPGSGQGLLYSRVSLNPYSLHRKDNRERSVTFTDGSPQYQCLISLRLCTFYTVTGITYFHLSKFSYVSSYFG
jgi:hypothetical protein